MSNNMARITNAIINDFSPLTALVIGDLMLDVNLWGMTNRISPEAPVPLVKLRTTTMSLGGAGNVANNLAHLGLQTKIFGFVGNDLEGQKLLNMLSQEEIENTSVIEISEKPTTTKTRVICENQHLIRLDLEDTSPISKENESSLITNIKSHIGTNTDLILLSDYAKGTITPNLCSKLINQAKSLNIPIFIDPKGSDYSKYKGATLISPNRIELARATKSDPDNLDQLLRLGSDMRRELDIKFLIVTLGELGIALISQNETTRFPAKSHEVYDVTGAGDTTISVIASAYTSGMTIHDSINAALIAASIVISKIGTTAITKPELLNAVNSKNDEVEEKVLSVDSAAKKVEEWKNVGDNVVFTNGCFDLLHRGHLHLLNESSALGQRLIVGINSDKSVKKLKGEGRPILPENDRAEIISSLECVDNVVIFDEETPLTIIKILNPDILVKGSDYNQEDIVGSDFVIANGGSVVSIPIMEGLSTTSLIEKISNPAN